MKNAKAILILALTLVMIVALFTGCTKQDNMENIIEMEEADPDEMPEEETEEMELLLTLGELKKYDGTNGNPAYVAYDGVIYDVTNDSNWSSGGHGGNMVGTDITDKLNNAPHGTSKLSTLEAVGKIAE